MNTMTATSDLPWQELDRDLRAFIARRVRNQADVDDLVQRVLLQIVQSVNTLRHTERLHAWVYRTARNVVVDYYRSRGSRRALTTAAADGARSEPALPPAAFDDDDEAAALRELARCLGPMLRQLPAAHQEAVRLVDLEGATQQHAAVHAGVSLSGMKSRVQRGRQHLRDVLEACCRIDLDRRGGITAFAARHAGACTCGECGKG